MKKFMLLGLLFFAFFIRLYNINSPAIGYHNMKENEYISIADNMIERGNYVDKYSYLFSGFDDNKLRLYAQVPWVSYQIVLCRKLFGESLLWPRLIQVFMFLGALFVAYKIIYLLTDNFCYSYISIFFMSVLPLGNYFSRSLQPESHALFWMLLSWLFLLKYRENLKVEYFIGWVAAVVLTFSAKLSFLFPSFLVLFIFPYKKVWIEGKVYIFKLFSILAAPTVLMLLYFCFSNQLHFDNHSNRISLFAIFTQKYWQLNLNVWMSYIVENYSLGVFIMAVLGLLLLFVFRRKDSFYWFVLGYFFSLVPYMMVFSDFLNQHSYYQFPFIVLIAISCAFVLEFLFNFFVRLLPKFSAKNIRLLVSLIFLVCLAPSIYGSTILPYGVLFEGLDVAGKVLDLKFQHKEKMFVYTHPQGYALCSYARSNCSSANTLTQFKNIEEQHNVKYLYINPLAYWSTMEDELREYVAENFKVKYAGLKAHNSSLVFSFVVLEKGGKYDLDKFLKENGRNVIAQKMYNTPRGQRLFVLLEERTK